MCCVEVTSELKRSTRHPKPVPFLLSVRPLLSALIRLPAPSTVKGAINHRLNGTGLRTETSWAARTYHIVRTSSHACWDEEGPVLRCSDRAWWMGFFPPQEGNEAFLLVSSSSIMVRETEHGHTVQSLGTWWQQIPQQITDLRPSLLPRPPPPL